MDIKERVEKTLKLLNDSKRKDSRGCRASEILKFYMITEGAEIIKAITEREAKLVEALKSIHLFAKVLNDKYKEDYSLIIMGTVEAIFAELEIKGDSEC